jgi:hypothetical protein
LLFSIRVFRSAFCSSVIGPFVRRRQAVAAVPGSEAQVLPTGHDRDGGVLAVVGRDDVHGVGILLGGRFPSARFSKYTRTFSLSPSCPALSTTTVPASSSSAVPQLLCDVGEHIRTAARVRPPSRMDAPRGPGKASSPV